jgi:hypothetical protein
VAVLLKKINYQSALMNIKGMGSYLSAELPSESIRDESFVVTEHDKISCVVPAFFINETACHLDGTSIIPNFDSAEPNKAVCQAICDWAKNILVNGQVKNIKMLMNRNLSLRFIEQNTLFINDNTRLYGYFDLTKTKDESWRKIRRRYKSKINSGATNLQRFIHDGRTPLDNRIIEFLTNEDLMGYPFDFAYLKIFLEQMKDREAFLFSYWYGKKVVGVVGIGIWKKFSPTGDFYYDIGAYDHTCPVPLHFCLYDALTHFQLNKIGSRIYLLHGIPLQRPDNQKKLSDIDFFKKGFCSDTFLRTYKIVSLKTPSPSN